MPRRLAPRIVTLLIALAGAGTAGSAHADVKQEVPLSAADSEKLLAFFDELVDTAAKHAADCAAQAGAVDGVVTKHLNTLQMMWAAKKAQKVVPKDVREKLDKRALEMVSALRKCWDHDGVKKAFQRMKPPKEEAKPKPKQDQPPAEAEAEAK
jgi:hypothetical protein